MATKRNSIEGNPYTVKIISESLETFEMVLELIKTKPKRIKKVMIDETILSLDNFRL